MGKWVRLLEMAVAAAIVVVAADLVMGGPGGGGVTPSPQAPAVAGAPASLSPTGQVIDRTRILLREAPTHATPPVQHARKATSPKATRVAAARVDPGQDPLQGLTLVGTVDADACGAAFFTDGRGQQVILRRGQVVRGWKVVAMGDSCVKLQKGASKRMAYLPSLQSPPGLPATSEPGKGLALAGTPSPVRSVTDSNYMVWSRSEARAFLVGAEPTGDIRATAQTNNGNQWGCTVDWIRPSSPLARIGVQERDILLAANGRPIHDSDDFKWVYQALQRESRVEVALERGGRRAAIHVEVR